MKCTKCNKETSNKKFCSRSCSNSFNNSLNPKRKRKRSCYRCLTKVLHNRKYCEPCNSDRRKDINNLLCFVCRNSLVGTQTRFCSKTCSSNYGNSKHQTYIHQQHRGLKRKRILIEKAGGSCTSCGYSKNIAAMVFHHTEPHKKSFTLDIRHLSNRKWDSITEEFKKCELLCSNCHREHHHPLLTL